MIHALGEHYNRVNGHLVKAEPGPEAWSVNFRRAECARSSFA